MSFNKYYKIRGFSYNTKEIDECIRVENEQNNYYSEWVRNYKRVFDKCPVDDIGQWFIRYEKSTWEIYTSATLLLEARCNLNNKCFASFYFNMYYSLFHAIYSLLYMNPFIKLDKLFRMSHSQLFKNFKSYYTGTNSMFGQNEIDLFENLKYKREYYSYNVPFNLVFSEMQPDYYKTEKAIRAIFQATAFHINIASRCSRHVSVEEGLDIVKLEKMFKKAFSNMDVIGLEKRYDFLLKAKAENESKYDEKYKKRQILIDKIQAGDKSVSNEMIELVSADVEKARKELNNITSDLEKTQKDLSNVVLDDAAKNILWEIKNGRTKIGIDSIQIELDHIFDEFHGYDSDEMYKKCVPEDFCPVNVSTFVMDTLIG